ncbi:hypothetical protein Q5752_005075 [Cryptotrichosporon argae]
MSKRGLSREEKLSKLLELFHETAEFYTLKELEKIAPKSKGIVQQSVKEILDELVGDGHVQFDKIGTSNYFWAFPSAASEIKKANLARAKKEIADTRAKTKQTKVDLAAADKGREDTPERRKLLAELDDVRATSEQLKAELAKYGAADPVRYERKARAIEVARVCAQRWTDNTLTLLQFANAAGAEESELRAMLNINDEWDEVK